MNGRNPVRAWLPADFAQRIEGGEVYALLLKLWDWPVPRNPADVGLDEEEQTRWARYRRAEDRKAFMAGRWLIRGALEALTSDPNLPLSLDPRGKPFCPNPGSPRFNLTHGGGWVALAIRRDSCVGVDVEDVRREVAMESVARRYFSSPEREWVREEGREAFFRVWTRKEARVKATGTGLTSEMAEVDTLAEERERIWAYHTLRPEGTLIGCVAYPGERVSLRVHRCRAGSEARRGL